MFVISDHYSPISIPPTTMSSYTSYSPLETRQIGKELARTLTGGDIIILKGELGAGKTAFTKGIAEGLGVTNEVKSPTFTLMSVYHVPNHETIKEMVHVDTYRLNTFEEILEIGIEEYLGRQDTLMIIEWPEKVDRLLENKKIIIVAIKQENETERTITIETRW